MKKILCFMILSFCFTLLSTVQAAPSQKIVLIYKVPDTILQAQNADEDMEAGKIEFEKMLTKNYSKRFIIEEIKKVPFDDEIYPSGYNDLVLPGQLPFVVKISLEGQGQSASYYQNAYGAQGVGVSPTVKVRVIEAIPSEDGTTFYGHDYKTKDYGFGTFAVGKYIYNAQPDPRKVAKGAVVGYVQDICKLNPNINKYADPVAYEYEQNRYYGNFKATNAVSQKAFAEKDTRIQNFISWCNTTEEGKMYLMALNSRPNDKDFQIEYINSLISIGIYTENN